MPAEEKSPSKSCLRDTKYWPNIDQDAGAQLFPALTHPLTQWEGVSGAKLDPESRKHLWRGVSVLALTHLLIQRDSHKGGLCPQASASTLFKFYSFTLNTFLSRGIFTGYKPQDWVLEHPGSTNIQFQQQTWWHLANLQKTGESLNVSLCCHQQLHFQTIGLLVILCHPWAEGRAGTACNLQVSFPRPWGERPSYGIEVNAGSWGAFSFLKHNDCLYLSMHCLYLSINSYALLQANYGR